MALLLSGVLILKLAAAATAAEETGVPEHFAAVRHVVEEHCGECHTGSNRKGGFSLNTQAAILEGSDNGEVLTLGEGGAASLLYELVTTKDEDIRMPPKGEGLTAEEADALRAWIDAGLPWEEGFAFGEPQKAKTPFREVALPEATAVDKASLTNPVDRFLAPYFARNGKELGEPVDDRRFIRRVSLDLVGLLPDTDRVERFVADTDPDKRAKLVDELLADQIAYADHWMTFWNDRLRNNYYGTGFIDGGRLQITGWLYESLLENKPYDQFVHELIDPVPGSEGYVKGIVWRGVVNASQRPVIQAAQNVSQVFLGTNLKCASCHDSFTDGWKLEEAYAFASLFSEEGDLEIVECNNPTGETVQAALLFPELGKVNASAPLAERRKQAADLLTGKNNGLFARTLVNRFWKVFFGRGLVEPVDTMANDAWHPDLLDWLAADFRDSGYDMKHVMRTICTSRAYQLEAVGRPAPEKLQEKNYRYVFEGPYVRRMTAEQLFDAVAKMTGSWASADARDKDPEKKFRGQGGQFISLLKAQQAVLQEQKELDDAHEVPIQVAMRASASKENDFLLTLGRPNREQVVTQRDVFATTLQALELTNGQTFDAMLKRGAVEWTRETQGLSLEDRVTRIYQLALGRAPNAEELKIAAELLRPGFTAEEMADFLWAIFMLPEFQLLY